MSNIICNAHKKLLTWLKENTFKAKVKAWSYSRYSDYKKCPFMFARKHLVKEEQEPVFAMIRGNKIHKLAEEFVKGNITGMPKELVEFSQEFKELKRAMALTEVDLTVTRGWNPTHTKDWNNAWCRGRGDSLVVFPINAIVIDYKTGGIYPEPHEEQAEIMSALTLAHNPEIETVDAELWYLDKADTLNFTYTAKQLKAIMKKWEKNVAPMFTDKEFKPTPSVNNCHFCPFNNKGKCIYVEK